MARWPEDLSRKRELPVNVSTPEYAAQFFPEELAKYAKLVKKAGVELQ